MRQAATLNARRGLVAIIHRCHVKLSNADEWQGYGGISGYRIISILKTSLELD